MLAEIYLVRLEALLRERAPKERPGPAQDPRFVPIKLPRR